jgi:hypothetical protein
MPHLDWRVAGAAGLAAGITVGGFSLVSASGVDRAINTVEIANSQAAPAADGISFVASRTSVPSASIAGLASHDVITVEMPAVSAEQPTATPKPDPTATPKPDPTATPKAAHVAHVDSVDSVAGVASVASVASVATVASVASVASAASVASVASVDSVD